MHFQKAITKYPDGKFGRMTVYAAAGVAHAGIKRGLFDPNCIRIELPATAAEYEMYSRYGSTVSTDRR